MNTQGHVQCVLLLFHEHDPIWHSTFYWSIGILWSFSELARFSECLTSNFSIKWSLLAVCPAQLLITNQTWHSAYRYHRPGVSPPQCWWFAPTSLTGFCALLLTALAQLWHLSTIITSPHCGKRSSMESVSNCCQHSQIFEKLNIQITIMCFQTLI